MEAKLNAAATKLQKFYRSYRTRRNLADCAVVVEELWWKALEFAALRRSSVSFFNSNKSETAVSRWARARTRAAKVGKGLSKAVNGQQLALRHWLEAVKRDLSTLLTGWMLEMAKQLPLTNVQEQFYSLNASNILVRKESVPSDDGRREADIQTKQRSCKHKEGSKWIFVLGTCGTLYVGEKVKGQFHHSSFLAGGATIASGRLVVHHGNLHAVWAYSGHYRPTQENFMELCSFLEEHHVDLTNVKKYPIDDDIPREVKEVKQQETSENTSSISAKEMSSIVKDESGEERRSRGVELRYKWSTGVGNRIGCMRDYPAQMQFKALEHVNLSPRLKPGFSCGAPRPSPKLQLSPRLAYLGLVSPRVRLSAAN
ncbi:Detected protein of unknown function [Hibiscus syriacus]|uniref:Calmodulin-binding family protein n=1 Tax=Hibiscus syriacus TaxID=106335 RepID=A0A6A2X605_HIBSY|nr:Detected protein of unknown function [Hibiscus syriacus]